jgi:hypothetical protein
MNEQDDPTDREITAALIAAVIPLHPYPEQLKGKSRGWLELEQRAIQHSRQIIIIDGSEAHPVSDT